MRLRVWSAALLMLAYLWVPVRAGVICGTVRPPVKAARAKPKAGAYAGRASSLPKAVAPRRGAVTDAVVFVDSIPDSSEAALAHSGPHPRLAQKNQSFVPRVLPVASGTTVDFPNLDPIYHNVFSPSPLRRFDLGKYSRGKFQSVTFVRPGIVNVYCDIHSDMEAFVVVVPHHAFTQPADSGSFALPPLPAGRYLLRAWHPDYREIRRTVAVPESGDVVVDLNF